MLVVPISTWKKESASWMYSRKSRAGFSQALWDELTQNDLDSRLLFATPMSADSLISDPAAALHDALGSQGEEENVLSAAAVRWWCIGGICSARVLDNAPYLPDFARD